MSTQGDGWTTGHLDELGEGYGFRKIRKALGVDAFGVNAIVMPPNFASGFHYHDEQQELYFVHRGTMEIEFLDGTKQRLEEGSLARVDAPVSRKLRNIGEGDAVYLIVGAKDGYVGRDAHLPEGETSRTGT